MVNVLSVLVHDALKINTEITIFFVLSEWMFLTFRILIAIVLDIINEGINDYCIHFIMNILKFIICVDLLSKNTSTISFCFIVYSALFTLKFFLYL